MRLSIQTQYFVADPPGEVGRVMQECEVLRVFLGDLTHATIGLATEVFPLNIGLVGAYSKKIFGDRIELTLFKYIDDLEKAIEQSPPDLLGLSNYPWCHNVDLAMFRMLEKVRPDALRILGGPNFPHDNPSQDRFLRERPLVDAHVYLDGELGFANIIQVALDAADLNEAREVLRTRPLDGVAQQSHAGGLLAPPVAARLRDLDEIPSPYQMGLLEPFFDGRLSPMIQTNRGCPFQCTFCADGTKLVSKVTEFSLDRVLEEIRYIAGRVPKNVHSLFISDLNFGMYKRDEVIAATLAQCRAASGFPQFVDSTTGKNSKERVIRAVKQLEGTLGLTMSVQSMTPEVLSNIKRDNIKLADFLDLKPAIKQAKLPTVSEIILGLPGETKQSHLESLSNLINAEMDIVVPYTLMLLNGSELATPEQRAKWGYQTKFRVLPRDFTRLRNGETVVEVEEVVVGSNTLSFDDYMECRKVALMVSVVNNIGFRALLKFLIRNDFKVVDLLLRLVDAINEAGDGEDGPQAPVSVVKTVREFVRETRDELWDNPEDLQAFFQDEDNFAGLLDGRFGANLIQTYRARVYAHCFDDLARFVFHHVHAMLDERLDEPTAALLREVEVFCRGRIHNLLGKSRLEEIPEADLSYDFAGWIGDPAEGPLEGFRLPEKQRFRFMLTGEQFRLVEDALDHFGHNDLGMGKALNRININTLWRAPVRGESFDDTAMRAAGRLPRFYQFTGSNWHYSG